MAVRCYNTIGFVLLFPGVLHIKRINDAKAIDETKKLAALQKLKDEEALQLDYITEKRSP